jgi:hypothetical protein
MDDEAALRSAFMLQCAYNIMHRNWAVHSDEARACTNQTKAGPPHPQGRTTPSRKVHTLDRFDLRLSPLGLRGLVQIVEKWWRCAGCDLTPPPHGSSLCGCCAHTRPTVTRNWLLLSSFRCPQHNTRIPLPHHRLRFMDGRTIKGDQPRGGLLVNHIQPSA